MLFSSFRDRPIASSENPVELAAEIRQCEQLGETSDKKSIFLYHYRENSSVMREIGRLREFTFRSVGEGTGLERDLDQYDIDYEHIVLWDDLAGEIVGAYRIAQTAQLLMRGQCQPALYTQTLFDFATDFDRYFAKGLELGRSFVQPKYWGKRSLDYLWFGIGAYLRSRPNVRYLFGPVSISNTYPIEAKDLLVNYYSTHFAASNNSVTARTPYEGNGSTVLADFRALKSALASLGVTVPTLYKQYTDVCDPGGVQFFDFNVDQDFGDCIDGLILVDLTYLKSSKRRRYLADSLAA